MLNPPIERLYLALAAMVELERQTQRTIPDLHDAVSAHPEARDLMANLKKIVGSHLDALWERMQLTPDSDQETTPCGVGVDPPTQNQFKELHPVSTALGVVYTMVQEAIIGYAAIQPIALRAKDSWVTAEAGTTAHISRRHMQEYMDVAGQINALIHDVVVWELEEDGVVCQCTCPSCSIGICVGAISSRAVLGEAWIAAFPPVAEHGVELRPPRPGSAAAAAGFQRGDVIVAIDGEKIDSLPLLQRLIRDRAEGDWMEFTVRRQAGEATVTVVHRRDGQGVNEDECVLPAGQSFYLERTRDVKRRLRKRRSTGSLNGEAGGADLTSLSVRELQVLRLVAQGATNPIIADELEVSRATVARHVASILAKLELANRTEAAAVASRHGLLSKG